MAQVCKEMVKVDIAGTLVASQVFSNEHYILRVLSYKNGIL